MAENVPGRVIPTPYFTNYLLPAFIERQYSAETPSVETAKPVIENANKAQFNVSLLSVFISPFLPKAHSRGVAGIMTISARVTSWYRDNKRAPLIRRETSLSPLPRLE
jgi:hypothetical protein